MENPRLSLPRPRLLCRGRARAIVAAIAAGVLPVGCTTTHLLGRIDDPGVREQIDAIAADGDAILHVREPPRPRPPSFGERVKGVTPDGLIVEPTRGQPLLIPRERVRSLSRYYHARGAGDGAIGGGLAGLIIGVTLGTLLTISRPGCSDGCSQGPDTVPIAALGGLILGGIGAVLGAGLGAAGGHEERFEIEDSQGRP